MLDDNAFFEKKNSTERSSTVRKLLNIPHTTETFQYVATHRNSSSVRQKWFGGQEQFPGSSKMGWGTFWGTFGEQVRHKLVINC